MEPDSRPKIKHINLVSIPTAYGGSGVGGTFKASTKKKDLKVYPVSNESAKGDPEGSILGKDESRIYETPDIKRDGGMIRGDGVSRVKTKGKIC